MAPKSKGLIPRGDPLALRDLVLAEMDAGAARMQQHLIDLEFFEDRHAIAFPAELTNPIRVTTGWGAQQVGLLRGMLEDRPTVRIAVASANETSKRDAEEAENFTNSLFPVLEVQAGRPVYSEIVEDQLKLGLGVDALDLYEKRLSEGAPKRGAYDNPADYSQAYAGWVKRKGAPNGALPMVWRSVRPTAFYWRSDPDSGGVALGIEVRRKTLKELLENPRYAKNLPKLFQHYETLKSRKGLNAMSSEVAFVVVEDQFLTSYLVMGLDMVSRGQNEGMTEYQMGVSSGYPGEIADQFPNPLDRVRYTITPGITSTSPSSGLQYQSCFHSAMPLAIALDTFLSFRITRQKQYSFPAWVQTTQSVNVEGSSQFVGLGEGGTPRVIELRPGSNTVTPLPPGTALQPVISPGGGPDEIQLLQEIRRQANLHGIPDTILDTRGVDSGYLMESVTQNIQVRFRPVIGQIQAAHMRRVLLLFSEASYLREALSVGRILPQGRQGEWYTFDPEQLDGLDLLIEPVYSIRRPQNTAADIQNASLAVQNKLLDWGRAVSRYLGIEDTEAVRRDILLDEARSSQQMHDFLVQQALQQAGLDQAQVQQSLTLDQLLQASPSLVAAIGASMQSGAPGSQALQSYLEKIGAQAQPPGPPTVQPFAGQSELPGAAGPPMPMPTGMPNLGAPAGAGPSPLSPPPGPPQAAGPPGPSPIRLPGGRRAGQMRQAGGPRGRAGGL